MGAFRKMIFVYNIKYKTKNAKLEISKKKVLVNMFSFKAVKTFNLTSVTFCTSVSWDTNNNTK